MANYRISAMQKDNIRKIYRDKINKLEEKKKEIVDKLVEKKLEEYNSSNIVERYKAISEEFYDFVMRVDEDKNFINYQIIRALNSVIEGDLMFKNNKYSDVSKYFCDEEPEINNISNKQIELNKECNKLIWDLEMAPKSSNDYKEAFNKAQYLLFGE